MKRVVLLASLLAIIMFVFVSLSLAGSAYMNARADLAPVANRGVDHAKGNAIINYVKDEGVWQLQVNINGLVAYRTYRFQIGIQDQVDPQQNIATFTTDKNGHANFHAIVENLLSSYSIVRIVDITGNRNPKLGGTVVMRAREDGILGMLTFRGNNRLAPGLDGNHRISWGKIKSSL